MFHDWIVKQVQIKAGENWANVVNNVLGGTSAILWDNGLTEEFPINRGVRQGDVISPLLFNIALAPLLQDIRDNLAGAEVLGHKINTLAYADDLAVYVNNKEELEKLKFILKKFKSQSGLTINKKKTQFMRTYKSTTPCSEWKIYNKYCYLGITFNNTGRIIWKPITEKFIKMCKLVKAGYMNNTLMHKIRCINAYCISVLTYHLRISSPPPDEVDVWKVHIKYALTSHQNKIAYSRLIVPKSEGGYGLIEPVEASKALRKAWLDYWSTCEPSQCTELIQSWDELLKKRDNKDFGPVWSWNKYEKAPFWQELADVFNEIFIYFKRTPPYKAKRWKDDDKLSDKVDSIIALVENTLPQYKGDIPVVTIDTSRETARTSTANSCWYLPCGVEFKIPFPTEVYKVKKHHMYTIKKLGIKDNKFWKEKDSSLILTPAQQKWNTRYKFDVEEYLKEIPEVSLPEKWKYTVFDHLNVCAAMLYKKEKSPKCRSCGQTLRSGHFVLKENCCPVVKIIEEWLKRQRVDFEKRQYCIARYMAWIIACLRDDRRYYQTLIRFLHSSNKKIIKIDSDPLAASAKIEELAKLLKPFVEPKL